jgi:multiple sugar transport system substrate-binding protein
MSLAKGTTMSTSRTSVSGTALSRRRFLQAGTAGAALLGLSACGGGDDAAGGGRKVVLAASTDQRELLRKPLAQFQAAHGVTVEYRTMPADTGAYFDQIRTQFQAGSDDIDVIAGDVSWPAQLAAHGWLADLTPRLAPAARAAFLPATIAANTYRGKLYGVPWFNDAGFLYYRKDLLEKAGYGGPPETWQELQEMALKVKADTKILNGYVFQGARYEGGTVNGTEFVRSSGGDVLRNGKVVIGEPAAVRGLQIARGLVASGASPASVAEFKEDESAGSFVGGKAVFLRSWGYLYSVVSDKTQSKLSRSQVGVTELPVAQQGLPHVNVGGGWNLFLNRESRRKDLAWSLITYLAAEPQQRIWATEGSLMPTLTGLYGDAEVLGTMPVLGRARTVVPHTTTPPISPYYADMSLAMAKHFNASLRGAEPPEQAAAALASELQKIVDHG